MPRPLITSLVIPRVAPESMPEKGHRASRRRLFHSLNALGLFALGLPSAAQEPSFRSRRIGFLSSTSALGYESRVTVFRGALASLGYLEGRNLAIEFRWADGVVARLPSLAVNLVEANVDLIVSIGTPATRAAQLATRTIPIVMVSVANPVESGIVASLASPGANITGVTNFVGDTTTKLLDVLRAIFPKIVRVAVLLNPANASTALVYKGVEAVSQAMGVRAIPIAAQTVGDIDQAFATMSQKSAEAFLTLADPFLFDRRVQITELAARSRIPAIYNSAEYVESGGLMSYSVNTGEVHRSAAAQVDKILRGASPASLPVEQPTKLELVLNLKAAREIGLSMPLTLLVRADRLLE